jgi:hypothetical protein
LEKPNAELKGKDEESEKQYGSQFNPLIGEKEHDGDAVYTYCQCKIK